MPASKASKKKLIARAVQEPDTAQQSAFNQLINENALLFFRMKVVAQEVHQQGEMSGGKRSLLRLLNESDAQTVPQISRARNVTRQHTQTLINELAEEGMVTSNEALDITEGRKPGGSRSTQPAEKWWK